MKIEMRSTYAGPLGTFHPEQVVDFDEPTANALIDGGFATLAEPASKAVGVIRTPLPELSGKKKGTQPPVA